jgi:hypothetical protein
MLEVNRALILEASGKTDNVMKPAVVISAATWGRGNDHSRLVELKKFQCARGFNSSVVARPPLEVCAQFFDLAVLSQSASEDSFLAVGVAFGKTHWEWWKYDGQENAPELF